MSAGSPGERVKVFSGRKHFAICARQLTVTH